MFINNFLGINDSRLGLFTYCNSESFKKLSLYSRNEKVHFEVKGNVKGQTVVFSHMQESIKYHLESWELPDRLKLKPI